MSEKHFNGFETNARGALVFLGLAVEQLRIVDREAAERIRREYLNGLDSILNHSIAELKRRASTSSESLEDSNQFKALSKVGQNLLRELVSSMPTSPPGLGSHIIPEMPILTQDEVPPSTYPILASAVSSNTARSEPKTPKSGSIYHRFLSSPQPLAQIENRSTEAAESSALGIQSAFISSYSSLSSLQGHNGSTSVWPSVAATPHESATTTTSSTEMNGQLSYSATKSIEPAMSLAELCKGSEIINANTTRASICSWAKFANTEKKGIREPVKVGTIGTGGARPHARSTPTRIMNKVNYSIMGGAISRSSGFQHSYPSSLSALVPDVTSSACSVKEPSIPSQGGLCNLLSRSETEPARTWASIAATVTPESKDAETSSSGSATSMTPSSGEKIKLLRPAAVAIVPGKPDLTANPVEESYFDELRVVWICDLPIRYKLVDVSFKITFGPIMSITLTNNPSTADTPGRAACVVFKSADSADRFLRNNVYIDGIPLVTSYDTLDTTLAAEGRIQVGESLVPNIASEFPQYTKFILGDPFPRNRDIHAMDFENQNLRRRLKIVRSRLFYDVELADFKREVYSVVNHEHVEFIHFYNPGEATIVLASIRVAEYVLSHFKKLSRKRGSGYEHIEIAMVHDFNEAPTQKLWSQFSKNGKPSSKGAGDGVEGLYQGPPLKGIDI